MTSTADSTTLLGRLKGAVNKVRFLIKSVANPSPSVGLVSLLRSSTTAAIQQGRRRLPLIGSIERPPLAVGLTIICDDEESDIDDCAGSDGIGMWTRFRSYSSVSAASASASGGSGSPSPHRLGPHHPRVSDSGGVLHRTKSCPTDEEDVNNRADRFIDNFYRQLMFEKQVSLQLRYYNRGGSFNSSVSPVSYSGTTGSNSTLTSPAT